MQKKCKGRVYWQDNEEVEEVVGTNLKAKKSLTENSKGSWLPKGERLFYISSVII